MYKTTQIIAEVKLKSPFGYVSKKGFGELFKIAESVGDIISIHTDPRWGGSFELLEQARLLTDRPILAKGIHARDEDVVRALECGANYVLVVGRIPDVGAPTQIIIEPNTLYELQFVPPNYKALWNSRDLKTGGLKKEGFAAARAMRKGWLGQASNIRTVRDIAEGADGVLVGTYLEEFARGLQF